MVKLTKSVLREMILEIMNEEAPKPADPGGPKDANFDLMDNPFDEEEKTEDDEEEQEESMTSKLKKEFKEYGTYTKHVREL